MSQTRRREIYCCGCSDVVMARLTDGAEIYPHRDDLRDLPFWKCDTCKSFVGCHWKTKDRTNPLGCIPTPELREARKSIHRVLDPLWKLKGWDRRTLYAEISDRIGWNYHTANVRTLKEADRVIRAVKAISEGR